MQIHPRIGQKATDCTTNGKVKKNSIPAYGKKCTAVPNCTEFHTSLSSPSHEGSTTQLPESTFLWTSLPSHRFSSNPPTSSADITTQRPSRSTGRERKKHRERENGREQPARRKRNLGRAPRRRPPSPLASETSREQNSAGEHRAAPRSGHPMPSSADLRAQQQRGSR